MKRKVRSLIYATRLMFPVLLFPVLSCTSIPSGSMAAIPPEADSDKEYAPILEKWHKDVSIFDQFQSRLNLHAVLFTEEMRKAYLDRWIRVRGDSPAAIGADIGGNLSLFVSFYTPDENYLVLDDPNLWTLRLQYGDRILAPTIVKRLFDKEIYRGFFPFVTIWSSEYLIVFDVSVSDSGDSAVLPESLSARFYSSLSHVDLKWP